VSNTIKGPLGRKVNIQAGFRAGTLAAANGYPHILATEANAMAPRKQAPLETYKRKRNFAATEEPAGKPVAMRKRERALKYLIQLHDASRLHFDFRIELDGVLKSWAVTRGPSIDPADKRLAVEVEDHPIEYGAFEGIIPKGEYGGGTVIIWDKGSWVPVGDPHKGLEKGHLDFELKGKRLKGEFHLVRLPDRGKKEKHPNWLLIKSRDKYARPGDGDAAMRDPTSVVSGMTIAQMAKAKKAVWHSNRS
jgi:bifunctional non-homologous end joining protein LigD